MTNEPRRISSGKWGTVEWAKDHRGRMPAREFFLELPDPDKAKMLALFKLLAETGNIPNREKFKKLGKTAGKYGYLSEFKSHQLRFLGDHRHGQRFLVAHAVRKKRDDLREEDMKAADKVLKDNDEMEARHG